MTMHEHTDDKLYPSNRSMIEAAELLTAITTASQRVLQDANSLEALWREVTELLNASVASAGHKVSRELYTAVERKHHLVRYEIAARFAAADALIATFQASQYDAEIEKMRRHVQHLDVNKIADAATLSLLGHARDKALNVPFLAISNVAAAHVPLYQVATLHHQALEAYLGRPSTFQVLTIATKELLIAAAGEVMPGLGVAVAVAEQLEPRIERELRQVPLHTAHLDRTLGFNDILESLLQHITMASDLAATSRRNLEELTAAFAKATATIYRAPLKQSPATTL